MNDIITNAIIGFFAWVLVIYVLMFIWRLSRVLWFLFSNDLRMVRERRSTALRARHNLRETILKNRKIELRVTK